MADVIEIITLSYEAGDEGFRAYECLIGFLFLFLLHALFRTERLLKLFPSLLDVEAKKNDRGKIRFDLIPPAPLFELANVYTKGMEKYGAYNWTKGMEWGRIFAAMMRHAWKWWAGERYDGEDGQHHLASVAWCAFTLMEYERLGLGKDDREPALKFMGLKRPLKIAVDLDNTLADTFQLYREWVKANLGKDVSLEELTTPHIVEFLGLDRAQAETMFSYPWKNWERVPRLEPLGPDYVLLLRELGHKVAIVSACVPPQIPGKIAWLERAGLGDIPFVAVPLNKDGAGKGELEFDVYIDDNPAVITEARKAGKLGIVFSRPWNRDVEPPRILSLAEAVEIIKRF